MSNKKNPFLYNIALLISSLLLILDIICVALVINV